MRGRCIAFLALMFMVCSAPAQDWPTRPMRVVVPFSAGSIGEILLRAIAPPIEAKLGQRFVIDTKPGAAGNIGTAEVARAAPDGYTLLLAPTANYAVNRHLFKDMAVDPFTAFDPIAMIAEAPLIAVVGPGVSAKTLKDLVDYIRANPGKLNYGSPGTGSPTHLTGALLSQMTGNGLVYVPYKGTPPMMQALMANDIQVAFPTLGTAIGAIKGGKARVLAVTAKQRLPELPDVPTSAEAGFPDLLAGNWWVISAPRGTDARIVERLGAEVRAALADPAIRKRIVELGHVPVGLTPAETIAFLKVESARYKGIVERGGIRPE